MDEQKYIDKIDEIIGKDLVSLIEYNNGDEVRHLAVCNKLGIKELDLLRELKEPPIVFTKEEVDDAIDVFPVEFLNIKRRHKLLTGEDIFINIEISKKNLRHQLEFEFRSKLVHLRQAYLSAKDKDLDNIILSAVPTLAPIIGALIHLKGEDHFNVERFITLYGVDTKVLKEISDARTGRIKLERDKSYYIDNLINILTELGKIVDYLEVT